MFIGLKQRTCLYLEINDVSCFSNLKLVNHLLKITLVLQSVHYYENSMNETLYSAQLYSRYLYFFNKINITITGSQSSADIISW